MLTVRKADPEKDLKIMAPMVNRFAEEIGLDEQGAVSLIATIPTTVSFLAFECEQPIGILGMIEDANAFWGQYLWVEPNCRRGATAGLLHRTAFRYCNGKPARIIADLERKDLYEKIGYTTTHYVMERAT